MSTNRIENIPSMIDVSIVLDLKKKLKSNEI